MSNETAPAAGWRRTTSGLVLAVGLWTGVGTSTALAQNTISKEQFNVGHQLGYLYSRLDGATLQPQHNWSFETGTLVYTTPDMPGVRNPHWQRRTLVQIPGRLVYAAADRVTVVFESDLVAEFPQQPEHSLGGNSPRFRTRFALLEQAGRRPALTLTVGVKFSSAKPTNISNNRHNFDDSNGLAGLGTGVADYFFAFDLSRQLARRTWLHASLGLAPVGIPVPFQGGPSQADQLPYGLGLENRFGPWRTAVHVAGFYGVLKTTNLDHYAIVRTQAGRQFGPVDLLLEGARGLTEESDTWTGGTRLVLHFEGTRPHPR